MADLIAGMCPSLTADMLLKLTSKGISKVLDFVSMDPERITALCGLPYKRVLAIRRMLLAQYSAFPMNGLDLYDETLNTVAVLSTGCSGLDDILDSGIYTGEVTEIVGESVSGKTQLCQTLAVNVAATLEQNVICIDTTGGWAVRRTAGILSARYPEKCALTVLTRIKQCRCLAVKDLLDMLAEIREALQTHRDTFYSCLKLIIIDSIASVLSPCFFNGSYVEGLSLLQSVGRQLNSIAKDFAISVVVTNNMVASGGENSSADNYVKRPALGRTWAYVSCVRITLRPDSEPCQFRQGEVLSREENGHRVQVLLDKSTRGEGRWVSCEITKAGIENGRRCRLHMQKPELCEFTNKPDTMLA